MTRRDIIIIAVLANIGVMAILFMLAFRAEDESVKEPTDIAYNLTEERPLEETPSVEEVTTGTTVLDEVDNALEDIALEPIAPPSTENEIPLIEVEPKVQPETVIQVPPPVTTSDVKMVDVTVKKGDALEKIARANGTTISAIKKANDLKDDRLKIGQVLHVPVNTKKTSDLSTKKVASKPIADGKTEYYVIKNGDNPWKIAKQFHLKLEDLLKLNNLDEDSARKLKAGDQIRVQ